MEIPVKIACSLPGLENVTITYNMAATDNDIKAWRASFGSEDTGVVLAVEGWPDESEPFGPDSPTAFRVWACNQGLAQAIQEFANDPFWMSGSSLSTPPIGEGS